MHKVIAIAGLSGSGKTTLCNMLSMILPKSVVIHGDSYMLKSVGFYQKEFEEIFKESYSSDYVYCFRKAVSQAAPEQYEKYILLSCPFIESEITKALNKVKENKDIEYLLVCWSGLPAFSAIWDNACFRIIVQAASEKERNERLEMRAQKEGIPSPNASKVRNEPFNTILKSVKSDFIITNYYDGRIMATVDEICSKIYKL